MTDSKKNSINFETSGSESIVVSNNLLPCIRTCANDANLVKTDVVSTLGISQCFTNNSGICPSTSNNDNIHNNTKCVDYKLPNYPRDDQHLLDYNAIHRISYDDQRF